MKNAKHNWVRGITGAALLVGVLLIASYGGGISTAAPPPSNPGSPFEAILAKLNEIMAAITGGSSGGTTEHGTLQAEHAAQTTSHGTLQTEHATQNTAHGKI